jgi:DNA replication and repair protein RecF
LIVEGLKLTSVRNLAPCQLEPGPHFNVLSGDNGQGKTNLLETIYVVGTLRSFRTQRLAELIRFGATEAYVGARVRRGGLERKYEVTLTERSRRVRLDGKPVRPISRYFGDFNVVLFATEDLRVARASPADRRRFLDRAVFNWKTEHLVDSQTYEKVLKSRNAILRELQDRPRSATNMDLLAVYDEQLAGVGARVIAARQSYLQAAAAPLRTGFAAITQTGWEVSAHYHSRPEILACGADSDRLHSALSDALAHSRARDVARGATGVGPHRDDLQFILNGQPAQSFASQGQLRAIVLAWKTSEMDILAATHGDPPVLLLDDVSSELDPSRNQFLFDFLRGRDNQCFITTTHPKHVLLSHDRCDFEVANGTISQSS